MLGERVSLEDRVEGLCTRERFRRHVFVSNGRSQFKLTLVGSRAKATRISVHSGCLQPVANFTSTNVLKTIRQRVSKAGRIRFKGFSRRSKMFVSGKIADSAACRSQFSRNPGIIPSSFLEEIQTRLIASARATRSQSLTSSFSMLKRTFRATRRETVWTMLLSLILIPDPWYAASQARTAC